MANSATLLSMTTRVRRRADMENTQFVTDNEIYKYLNDSLTELYDLFVTSYQHYVMNEVDTTLDGSGEYFIRTVPGQSNFGIDDFMKLEGISIDVGGRLIAMSRFMFGERDMLEYLPSTVLAYNTKYCFIGDRIKFTNDVANTPIKIWYIPCKHNLEPFILNTDYLGGAAFGNIAAVSADGTVITMAPAGIALVSTYFDNRRDLGLPAYVQNNVPTTSAPQSVGTIESVDVPTNTLVVTMHTSQNFQMLPSGGTPLMPSFNPSLDTVMHYLCEGWEEYAVIDAAIKCLEKEESNVETLMRDKEMMRVRIGDVAIERDAGTPFRVTDVNFTKYPNDWYFV